MHQKLQLWLNILTTKWYIFVQNKVSLIIKNSKDSKNGAKCYHRPLHHSFLSNPLKNLWHRYFNIGASKFFDMYLKFIFSVSPFMWIWNQSWKLTSLCTELWAVTAKSTKAMGELLAFSCRGWCSCHPLLACCNAFEMAMEAANILYFAYTDNSRDHVLAKILSIG